MGQGPLSGTGCAFPFTNTSMSIDPCDITCAHFLAAKYIILQVFCLALSSFALLIYLGRMLAIYRYVKSHQKEGLAMSKLLKGLRRSLEYWFFCGLFLSSFLISSIDIRGFNNTLSAGAYAILNEFVNASLISTGLILVDFWIVCAGQFSSAKGIQYKYKFVCLVYLNFVGWMVVEVNDVNNFLIFDGLKNLGGFIILVTYQIIAYRPIQNIRSVLLSSQSQIGFGEVEKKRLRNTVKSLDRKFVLFYFISSLGTIIFVVNTITQFTSHNKITGWAWVIDCEMDINSVIDKIIQSIGCVISFSFFSVPKSIAKGTSEKAVDTPISSSPIQPNNLVIPNKENVIIAQNPSFSPDEDKVKQPIIEGSIVVVSASSSIEPDY